MTPEEFKRTRLALGLTQQALADQLKRKRLAITRYEGGTRTIPGVVEVALQSIAQSPRIALVGIVAAGDPIEPIPQTERIEVPKSMLGRGETFALRVKGTSMRDDGILPGDVAVSYTHLDVYKRQIYFSHCSGNGARSGSNHYHWTFSRTNREAVA